MEYTLSIEDVHYQKGSLLDYNEVFLSEGPWPGKAYFDACRRDHRKSAPRGLSDYRLSRTPIVSQGPYVQNTAAPEPEPVPAGSSAPSPESGAAPAPESAPPAPPPSPHSVAPPLSSAGNWSYPRRLPQTLDESAPYDCLRTSHSAAADNPDFQTGR